MDQGQRGAGDGVHELEGALLPVILILQLARELGRRRTGLAASQDLLVCIGQKQGARLGAGFMQSLFEMAEQDVDAEHPHHFSGVEDGLGQGDHLALPGEVLIGVRQGGVPAVGGLVQGIQPVGLLVNSGVETKLAGRHPGIEIDKVIHPGEIKPGHVFGEQLGGGREQGREAQRQVDGAFPLAARCRQRPLAGQVADQTGGQVDGHSVQGHAQRRIDPQGTVELVGQGRLGVAAQPLLGLATHGFEQGIYLLILGSQLRCRAYGVALVQLGDLAKGVLQGEE
ncbi:hypothetical protein D3C79_652930 [compost metagenome]